MRFNNSYQKTNLTQSDVRFVHNHRRGQNIRYVFPLDKEHRYFLQISISLLRHSVHSGLVKEYSLDRITFALFNNVLEFQKMLINLSCITIAAAIARFLAELEKEKLKSSLSTNAIIGFITNKENAIHRQPSIGSSLSKLLDGVSWYCLRETLCNDCATMLWNGCYQSYRYSTSHSTQLHS